MTTGMQPVSHSMFMGMNMRLSLGLRPGGGMADATDLKSVFRKEVRVRSPPRAPLHGIDAEPAHCRSDRAGRLLATDGLYHGIELMQKP